MYKNNLTVCAKAETPSSAAGALVKFVVFSVFFFFKFLFTF